MKKLLSFVISVVFFCASLTLNNNLAVKASENIDVDMPLINYEGKYDNYTNSDNLLNDPNKEIKNYITEQYGTTIDKTHAYYDGIIDVFADDLIVEIIPKDFFAHRGSYFYIGNEYAFYISTEEYNKYSNYCKVFVIDITRTYDLNNANTPSQIVHTVEPLFQAQYYYLTTQDNFACCAQIRNYSKENSIVIPHITSDDDGKYRLQRHNIYYLKDIKFGAYMRNEQHYNSSDEEYSAEADKGSFFIRSDLYYKGKSGSNFSSINALVETVIGKVMDVMELGPIYETLDLLIQINNLIVDASDHFLCEDSYAELYKNTDYASAMEQINNNGFLNKAMYIGLTSDNDKPLLFDTKDENYVTCKFTVGQTLEWSTIFDSVISMSIVTYDSISKTKEIITGSGYYSENIREKEYKECKEDIYTEGYYLGNGFDYFKICPQYTGKYNIYTNKDAIIQVFDEEQGLININNNQEVELESEKNYYIRIQNKLKNNHGFLLMVETANFDLNSREISIKAHDTLIGKFMPTENCIYEFKFTYDNVQIIILNSEKQEIKTGKINIFSYYFETGKTYYILMNNITTNQLNGTFLMDIPEDIFIDSIVSKSGYTGDKYYIFKAPKNGVYYITTVMESLEGLTIKYKNTSQPISFTTQSGNGYAIYKNINLLKDEEIVVGFSNLSNNKYDLKITMSDNIYVWYANGEPLPGNSLNLKQGEECTIGLKINDMEIDASNIGAQAPKYITFFNGKVKVLNDAQPSNLTGYSEHLAIANNNQIVSLYINILVNIEYIRLQPLQTEDKPGIYFNVQSKNSYDKFILKFKFTFGSGKYIYKTSSKTNSDKIYLSDSDFEKCFENIQCKVEIISIEYYYRGTASPLKFDTSSFTGDNYTYTIDLNTMFAGGTGSIVKPLQISNERHLNNIRYCSIEYREDNNIIPYLQSNFEILNDIYLVNDWTPINVAMKSGGIYGANGKIKKIYNLRISETKSDLDIGFIRNIYGGNIENLKFENVEINVSNSKNTTLIGIGAIAGSSLVLFQNCSVTGNIQVGELNDALSTNGARYTYTGGICGSGGNYLNCISSIHIESFGNIGGIVGYTMGNISDCTNEGNLTLYHDNVNISDDDENLSVGGIVGIKISGTIKNCYSKGKIKYESKGQTNSKILAPRMGTIVGTLVNGSIINCNGNGTIDTGNLKKVTYGSIFNRKYHYQTKYVGGEYGKIE